jgi:hypothetical protein
MGGVRDAVCFSLRLRRGYRVQHSYCVSSVLCCVVVRFSPPEGDLFLLRWFYRFLGIAPPRAHAPSVRGNPMRLEFIRE